MATLLLVSLALAGVFQFVLPGGLSRTADPYRVVWPQSWSFYTGLANTNWLTAYRLAAGGRLATPVDPSDRSSGLDRTADTRSVALEMMATTVPQRFWQSCGTTVPTRCDVRSDAAHEFPVAKYWPTLDFCGVAAISVQRPTPVAGRSLPARPRMAYQVAVVRLPCATSTG
ncbi:MAG TPA: hypothetical protein VFX16_27210 [Pseudonocardiaceae bacterium]|nr:hypothetical protein [Pseudonocardiaceae bacterium]